MAFIPTDNGSSSSKYFSEWATGWASDEKQFASERPATIIIVSANSVLMTDINRGRRNKFTI